MLFSERSIWTMVHGIGLGGGALHAFAMETKEHMRRIVFALLAVSFVVVMFVSLLGVFVNKVAPLD